MGAAAWLVAAWLLMGAHAGTDDPAHVAQAVDASALTPMRAFGLLAGLWVLMLLALAAARIERRALLDLLRRREQELAEARNAWPRGLALAASDLYRPLTVVGLGSAALEDQSPDPLAAAVARDVVAAADVMRQRLADGLPPSQAGDPERTVVPIDLDEIVQEAVERSAPLRKARRLGLRTLLTPVDAIGDTEVLEAVVADLLDHVCRSARPGDEIAVQVWQDEVFAYLRIREQDRIVPPELQAASGGATLASPTGAHRAPTEPRLRLAAAAVHALGGDVLEEALPTGFGVLLHLARHVADPAYADPDATVIRG